MAGEAVISIVLEGLLSKLKSPIVDEFGLLRGVKNEKQKLENNLSRIKAVLQDAERLQIDLMTDKDFLGKLKNVAYDAEDLVDEFLFEAHRRKVENQDGMGRKVGNFFSPANPLIFRFEIAHKMKELRERFDDLAKESNNFQLLDGVVRHQPRISTTRETVSIVPDSSVPNSGVCGRDYEKDNYIHSLINSGNEEVLSVIPIVGMGGLGKTTLAQYVYNNERVVSSFNMRLWVYVSQDFDVGRILAKIFESAAECPHIDGSGKDLLITRVKENLSGKRFLLVLDDVWNEDYCKWEQLKTVLKCGAIGSKILLTTRNDRVAEIMDALHRPRLGTLSEDESWTLFKEVARPPTDFVSIGEKILRKCGGVPLAIKTLGGMLRNETNESKWISVRDSELWKQTNDDARILSILRLSYDHLTSSLKQCFSYCAVIPKGRRFDKDRLILQWIAQGFIHSDPADELLEEEGEMYFNALLQRSMFQVDEETHSYKMHDLIHDLLRSVAGKESFVVEASMMSDLTRQLALCNDETRHLAWCVEEWAAEPKSLDALKKCKKLRSMISYAYCGHIDINIWLSFSCLRALDLSHQNIYFLPNSIDRLRHLRYFDISNARITELPETICNLHNLQTLIVIGVWLEKWPENMKRMISLRHIRFNVCFSNFPLPKGLGKLTFLRTLPKSKFIITKESGAQIEELKDLDLLWGNIHIGGLDNITNVRCVAEANLKGKKHVKSLTLSWSRDEATAAEGNAKEVIEILEPHSDLKELSFENYMGLGFPSWMTEKLTKLKKLSLSSCKRCVQLLPLAKVQSLESLHIFRMDAVKYIVEFDRSHNYKDLFPSLKELRLSSMPNLEGWSSPQEDGNGDEQGRERDSQAIFKFLITLSISKCPKLTGPPRLPLLPSLESLEITKMSWDVIEIPTSQSLMDVKLDEMPNLERWSPHEVDDGAPVIFRSLRSLRISKCPKLICLPQLLLPALEVLRMLEVGCDWIEFSTSKSLELVVLTEMPNLERWSPHEADDGTPVIFRSLRTLIISKCPKLICLPQLLPALEVLKMCEVGWEWIEFSTSKSLKVVELNQMPNLERWSPQKGDDDEQVVFNTLVELVVKECPKMVRLPHFLPSLQIFKIDKCNEKLLGSVAKYTSLSELNISVFLEVKCLPEEIGRNHTSLSKLEIWRCPKLSSLSYQLENLLALKELIVVGCEDLVLSMPDGSLPLNSLEMLQINGLCEKQSSLPGNGIVLPSLKVLRIHSCENIESLSANMLKNLTELEITVSSKVWSSLVSLENLKSLEHLRIGECPGTVMMKLLKSMENLTSLTKLSIVSCLGLRSLPESIKVLTSLNCLWIENCPDMRSLPEGLQRLRNLEWLNLKQCPVLERRVQCNKGQDWHKVAHVKYIQVFASQDTEEGEESSDQRPHLLLHSLPSCCSYSPSSSSPPPT